MTDVLFGILIGLGLGCFLAGVGWAFTRVGMGIDLVRRMRK